MILSFTFDVNGFSVNSAKKVIKTPKFVYVKNEFRR